MYKKHSLSVVCHTDLKSIRDYFVSREAEYSLDMREFACRQILPEVNCECNYPSQRSQRLVCH
ncbi:hypothetical protein BaRGS_00013451, partial [Batillaria attramentaria]